MGKEYHLLEPVYLYADFVHTRSPRIASVFNFIAISKILKYKLFLYKQTWKLRDVVAFLFHSHAKITLFICTIQSVMTFDTVGKL